MQLMAPLETCSGVIGVWVPGNLFALDRTSQGADGGVLLRSSVPLGGDLRLQLRPRGRSPRTAAFHKYRMMEELQAKTNAELIHFAIKNNIVAL